MTLAPQFTGILLDHFLANGYYRMHQSIFTTHQVNIDGVEHPVFWLRTRLDKLQLNKAAKQIVKLNKKFTAALQPGVITEETEALFQRYTAGINFHFAPSLQDYLYSNATENLFDTTLVTVRDGDKLIAAGYFDKGAHAIAGILNCYDPAYKKYSPGKYLIFLKIFQAMRAGMQYYYTGYISLASTKFDYKLFPDPEAVEVYLPADNKWVPYNSLGKEGLWVYAVATDSAEAPGEDIFPEQV